MISATIRKVFEMAMFKKNNLAFIDLSLVRKDYAWYSIVTLFNHEEKYVETVKDLVAGSPLENLIQEYYVPIKYIKEIKTDKKDKKKVKIRKVKDCYAGYVFIKCVMTSQLWNLLRSASGASVILSTGGYPTEISEHEIMRIKKLQQPEGFTEAEVKKLRSVHKMKVSMQNLAVDNVAYL